MIIDVVFVLIVYIKNMATKKLHTDLVNQRDFILSNLSKELSDLISEESKEHILHIIGKLVYNKKNMTELSLYLQVYLAALNNLYKKKNTEKKRTIIEENLDSLCSECILYTEPITPKQLKNYSALNKKHLKEVKTLQMCLDGKLIDTDFNDKIGGFKVELNKLELSLAENEKEILMIKLHLKSKGPKPDLVKFSFATKLAYQFAKDIGKYGSFKLDSRYADFFIHKNSKRNTLKANYLNITALALNLIGHRTSEKQLSDGLRQYSEFENKESIKITMRDMINQSSPRWIKSIEHKAHKEALIAALKKHSLQIYLLDKR